MMKRVKPLVVIAALVFMLGFSQNVSAISEGDAEDAADEVAGLAIGDVLEISDAVDSGGSVDLYSLAVSLLVNDEVGLISERSLPLLLGGTGSKPHGNVEKDLLSQALADGIPKTGVNGNIFIKVFPLAWDAHPACVTCHIDFEGLPAGERVGAVSIRVNLNQ